MKKTLLLPLLLVLTLAGCATPVAKIQTVVVDKPVLSCPKPPPVQPFVSKVDTLTPADANDPGKVVEFYKYDTQQLRALIVIYDGILKQYDATSTQFGDIQKDPLTPTLPTP